MTRRSFYGMLALLFLIGLTGVALAPEPTLVVLSLAVPIVITAALVATAYLVRVYLFQRIPRSRFFRMVLELFGSLVAIGAWVGYLTVARLTERARAEGTLEWALPAPSTMHSAPISALIVIVVFASPVRFALEVWLVRRHANRSVSAHADLERELTLDRD